MPLQPKLRSIICLSFVFLVHFVLIVVLHPIHHLSVKKPSEFISLRYITTADPPNMRTHQTLNNVTKLPKRSNTYQLPNRGAQVPILVFSEPNSKSTITSSDTETKLDLEALRSKAVSYALTQERSPIQIQNDKNLKNRSLEAAVEKGTNDAEHSDCRTAYANSGILTGLLAPIRIAADLARDKGCKF